MIQLRQRSSSLAESAEGNLAWAAACQTSTGSVYVRLGGAAGTPRRSAPHGSGGHMVAKKTGTSVKNKALYKRLRTLGVSVKESARVANASAKTPSKKASARGGAASSYANWKVPELRRRAKKVGIKGRSTMNKKQLVKALRAS
jgi:hypothetical protein